MLIGFGIIFIFVIITTFVTMHSDFQDFVADKEMQQVCFVIKGGVEKIYFTSGYRPPFETRMGSITLALPGKIAGLDYSARFRNSSVLLELGRKMYECRIGFNATYAGLSDGGPTRIELWKNSTSDRIEMRNA
jgi:hypothetical protein